ncbi:cysteine-rich receptor-like protein kinase 24 isoform X2 [Salvia miltiorrhiza]|uniref:cysteine-rich receptor-like protein kinase 24 isoform X2 n=1 Tax=Salvia miltiorrhiza TaxID=226208 RepID=UPI0025AD76CF|nr:cysteine-rich receptor-like protein kinase 24 isoform X2 [Salvia miltiorrhiza]
MEHLLIDEQRCRQLQWSARFKIIIGIAKGVIYLHQELSPKTIHRNLNPTNIFLDNEMNPKISGFAAARYFQDDDQSKIGYLPPEYFLEGRISEKTDVYNFGVLVLEILSGKRNSRDTENLIGDTWKLLTGNKDVFKTVDGYLGEEFSEEEASRCIQVGLLCTQYGPQQRPKMASALKMLLGEDVSLQEKMAQAHCPSYLDPDFADLPNFDFFNPRNCSNERQSYFHSVAPHNMEVDYATNCVQQIGQIQTPLIPPVERELIRVVSFNPFAYPYLFEYDK